MGGARGGPGEAWTTVQAPGATPGRGLLPRLLLGFTARKLFSSRDQPCLASLLPRPLPPPPCLKRDVHNTPADSGSCLQGCFCGPAAARLILQALGL